MEKRTVEGFDFKEFGCNEGIVRRLVTAMGYKIIDKPKGRPVRPGDFVRWKVNPDRKYTVITRAAYKRGIGSDFGKVGLLIPAISHSSQCVMSLDPDINEHTDGIPISEYIDD